MKIIFLDIDGVLNSQELAWKNKEAGLSGYGGWFDESDSCEHSNVLWGDKLVANLKKIVDETGAKIVMSSTWRCHFTVEKFKEMFAVYLWNDVPVIDHTPRLSGGRGNEVKSWLNEWQGESVEAYVILDDCNEFNKDQLPYFINTDFMIGLSENDTEKAIQILNT